MKTIFDKPTRDELTHRINTLTENSTPQWGKMNVHQMLKHCTLWEELALGRKHYKRAFIGRIFGKLALKVVLRDTPLKRNTPTIPELRITENADFSSERAKWITLIGEHAHPSGLGIDHPFFGKITQDQIGYLVYKHTDHHLRQFNA